MQPRPLTRFAVWAVTLAFLSSNTVGAMDLADEPLVASGGDPVRPNIFFILDDSLSMNSEYMPDSVEDNDDDHCYRYSGYNKVYYNPNVEYPLPVTAAGAGFANASFNGAWDNGFNTGSGTTNLGTEFETGENPLDQIQVDVTGVRINGNNYAWQTGTGGILRVRYSGTWYNRTLNSADTQNPKRYGVRISGTWYYERTWQEDQPGPPKYPSTAYYARYIGSNPGNPGCADSDYQIVQVTSASSEAQNFANWYSYYRNRLLTMKSSSGLAFQNVDGKYRVGFTVISSKGTSSGFLGNKTFEGAHREDWYDMLYDTTGASFTPLRGALSKAGRYYAGTLVTGDDDPVQYACQRNYTILTTDGLWNTNDENTPAQSGTNYGAYRADNSTPVGDQDSGSGVARPYRDGDGTHENTLADVAMYYYETDLRTSGLGGLTDEGNRINVQQNIVPDVGASHQHMVTFTMGMGVDGTLPFSAATLNGINQGSPQWPDPISNSGDQRIDDLWHAAVNGRGQYFSAKEPGQIVQGLSDVLDKIEASIGSSSAAATSTLQPVQGDDLAFIAKFTTVEWTGDLLAHRINLGTGALSGTPAWSAQHKLIAQVSATTDNRTIYTFGGSADSKLREFTADNLTSEISAGLFDADQLTQYNDGTYGDDQKTAATPEALIDYLRGQGANEDTGAKLATDLFRERTVQAAHPITGVTASYRYVLGDIVSAAPVYARRPPFAYIGAEDVGYLQFAAEQANRPATVYVGSNDGMLHAIDASVDVNGEITSTSGSERWAYVPSVLLPHLHELADNNYEHRFYVDGPLTIGDAYDATAEEWKTVLVGGLGAGGRAYYALDITDPEDPKALWEFGTAEDDDLGYSYGNPVITKRNSDGRWVVMFTSGYNNNESGIGDGNGRLYVLDAMTGEKLSEIVVSVPAYSGDEDLTGIGRVSNLVYNVQDNRTQYVYGGDLRGSLWRFNVDAGTAVRIGRTGQSVTDLGYQPITVQPELAVIDGHVVVFFGTGRFLGKADILAHTSVTKQQAIYAVKDTGQLPGDDNFSTLVHATANLVPLTLDSSTDPRTSTSPLSGAMDWNTYNGWYITVPMGERFNVDPGLQLGVLNIAANKPNAADDRCTPKGESVLYQIGFRDGKVLNTETYASQVVGNTTVQLPSGVKINILVMADGTTVPQPDPPTAPGPGGVTRLSWRELE